MRIKVLVVFLVLFLLSTSGCRVRYTLSGASVGDAKTFSVNYFRNEALLVNPTLSQDFTDQLKDRFMADTDLVLVGSDGDLHFEGKITKYESVPVNITADEVASSFRLTIGIKVKFTNKKNQEYEFDKVFSRFKDYTDPNLTSVEEELVKTIITEIIDDVFKESVVNW